MPDATDVQVEANWLYNIFVSEDADNVHMDTDTGGETNDTFDQKERLSPTPSHLSDTLSPIYPSFRYHFPPWSFSPHAHIAP